MAYTSADLRKLPTESEKVVSMGFGGGLILRLRGKAKTWLYKGRIGDRQILKTLGQYPEMSFTEAKERRDLERIDTKARAEVAHSIEEQANYWYHFAEFAIGPRYKKIHKIGQPLRPISEVCKSGYFKNIEHLIKLSNPAKRVSYENKKGVPARTFEERMANVRTWIADYEAVMPRDKQAWKELIEVVGQKVGISVAQKCTNLLAIFSDSDIGEKYHAKRLEINPSELRIEFKPNARSNAEGHLKSITYDIREYRSFVKAIKDDAEIGNNLVSYLIYVACHIPLRRGTLIDLKWADVNLEEMTLTVNKTKNDIPIVHPISEEVARVMKYLKDVFPDSPNVFPGKAGEGISMGATHVAMKRIGYSDRQTMHGCRSAFESYINEYYQDFGEPRPECIAMTMMHKSSNPLGRAYQRSALIGERRILLEKWSQFILG